MTFLRIITGKHTNQKILIINLQLLPDSQTRPFIPLETVKVKAIFNHMPPVTWIAITLMLLSAQRRIVNNRARPAGSSRRH